MNRRSILGLSIVLAMATSTLFLPAFGPPAHAQPGCASLRALGFGILPTNHPIDVENDTWGGDVLGMLGGEFVSGYFSGNDGNAIGHGISNTATNGHYEFVVGSDSFTIEVAHAVFNFPTGKAGFGEYKGHATIVAGTGKFQHASGSVDWEGPFFVWSPDGEHYYGRFNPTITGIICGISPQ